MRLTRASSYALHAVVYMAGQKKDGPTASHVIAEKRGIPERFLLKVLKPLVSAQVLYSVKGPNGGYRLARPAPPVTAEKRGTPDRFLPKVLKPLVSAQVLYSVKGPNGGYRLARPATEITILEVLEAVDGPIRGHAPISHDEPRNFLNRKLEQICNES